MRVEIGHSGLWRVEVAPGDAFAYKLDLATGRHMLAAHTTVRLTLEGFKLAPWEQPVPGTVQALSIRLAEKLSATS